MHSHELAPNIFTKRPFNIKESQSKSLFYYSQYTKVPGHSIAYIADGPANPSGFSIFSCTVSMSGAVVRPSIDYVQ